MYMCFSASCTGLLRHNSTNVTGMALDKLTDAWSSSFEAAEPGKKPGKTLEKPRKNHRKILIFGKTLGKNTFCGCSRLMFLMHCNWGSGMCPSKLDTTKKHWKFVAAKRDKKCKRKNRQHISEQTLTTTFKPRRLPGGLFSSWKWQLKSGLKRLHLVQTANT